MCDLCRVTYPRRPNGLRARFYGLFSLSVRGDQHQLFVLDGPFLLPDSHGQSALDREEDKNDNSVLRV